MKKSAISLAALAILASAVSAQAAVFTFTMINQTDPAGNPASATATVDVQATKVVVTLTNQTANTSAAGDLLTGFSFTGVTTPGLQITTESASFINVVGTTAADVSAGSGFNSGDWTLSTQNGQFSLNGSPQPNDMIIGPANGSGAYPNVNSSITGNHNPFINQTGTFTLNKPANFPENITSGTFFFNTDFTPVQTIPPGGGSTPEPASLGVLGLGAAGLLIRRRKA